MVFEKMRGGTLLGTIERRGHLSEQEASLVIRDITKALAFLHKKGKLLCQIKKVYYLLYVFIKCSRKS